jgi:nanoRNase/pAp phosphatase (c-di-AMP/oligoRNAs hydrolase)
MKTLQQIANHLTSNRSFQVFTHKDLDGAVSFLTFLWANPTATITYRDVTNMQLGIIDEYVKKTCNPPSIIIMDLSLRKEFIENLDYDFIYYFDHHKGSENYIKPFKQANIVYKDMSSNALLMRKLLKEFSPELTDAQKKLILLADDFDSNSLVHKESYDLNILFWTQFKNDFCYFINYYKEGFKPFSEKQKEIIQHSKQDAKEAFKNTKCFSGEMIIEGFPQKVIAATTDTYNNIVIDMLMSKYQPDILLYINTKSEKVSMRQKKRQNPIDLSAFAEKYCDGSGHMNAAGGRLTLLFMELTKKLKPL